MQKTLYLALMGIFVLAVIIRFLYFPDNVYFGYDQARDSYTSLEILKGKLKLIGPPSSVDTRLFHGPLIYYIYAPIYFLSNLDPEVVSFVFRIINALGIFFVFGIGTSIFNKKVGLIAAFIFAVSYEQSQYSLFLSHPSLAVLGVLIYYLGMSLVIFKKNGKGLILALTGLGLSIQFHYVNLFLLLGFLFYLIFFYKQILNIERRYFAFAIIAFLLTISSFVVAEIKFDFRGTSVFLETLTKIFNSTTPSSSFYIGIDNVFKRFIHDNFVSTQAYITLFSLILGFAFLVLIIKKIQRPQMLFLGIWLINGFIAYMLSHSPSYYHNPATSVSIVLLVSYIISLLWNKNITLGLIAIFLITTSNLSLITSLNQKGPNLDIIIQPEMLTKYEKQALDFCYHKSGNELFSINALTIPLYINTTWSYLFEWYGLKKYNYLPIWGGKLAEGYSNILPTESKRSNLPVRQCLIIEPTNGMTEHDKNNFLREEDYFSKIIEEKDFGSIKVQYREKY